MPKLVQEIVQCALQKDRSHMNHILYYLVVDGGVTGQDQGSMICGFVQVHAGCKVVYKSQTVAFFYDP